MTPSKPHSSVLVRITDEDGLVEESTLGDFMRVNDVDGDELIALRAGDRVAFGGGATPLFYVEIVS